MLLDLKPVRVVRQENIRMRFEKMHVNHAQLDHTKTTLKILVVRVVPKDSIKIKMRKAVVRIVQMERMLMSLVLEAVKVVQRGERELAQEKRLSLLVACIAQQENTRIGMDRQAVKIAHQEKAQLPMVPQM